VPRNAKQEKNFLKNQYLPRSQRVVGQNLAAFKGKLAGLLFLLAAASPGARATTYYVATTGNDSSAGTQTAPLATIQRGVDLAKAGDTVLVADGTYGPNGHYTCGDVCSQNGYSAPVTFRNSGTAAAPVTIAAQNKRGAILDCQLPSGYSGNGTDGVKACDAYFNFQGSASYIVISGFDIQRAYWVGAMVNASNSHITFRQNHFHHIGNRVYTVPTGGGYGIVGVYAGTGSSYITWDQNEFNNIGRLPHSSNVNDDYSHDHGLYIYNGPYVITNNIFYNQAAGWNIQTSPGSHDISIVNNTLIGGVNPNKNGCMMLWGQNTNVTIQNNIFYKGVGYAIDNYQTTQSGSLFDHNLVYGSSSGIVGSIGGSLTQTNNVMNVDPQFVAPASYDYHLQSASSAVDAGASVSVASDFDGNPRPLGPAFDLGAYEYTGSTSAAPAAPSALAAAASASSVNLSWANHATNASSVLIERSTNGGNFAQTASIAATATAWADSGLAGNTTYSYRVRAQNSAGMSSYSNTASATTSTTSSPTGTLPAAPKNVAAGQSSVSPRTQINVYWKAGSANQTGFEVFRSTDGVNFSKLATVGASAAQYNNSGLTPNTHYYYYVAAYNAAGESPRSNVDSTVTAP
jgi:hypothetical protein